MRRPESLHRYNVEVSPVAWGQLAELPQEAYRRVRAELEGLALRMGLSQPPVFSLSEPSPPITRSLALGSYLVLYRVEPEARRLTLLEVLRRAP